MDENPTVYILEFVTVGDDGKEREFKVPVLTRGGYDSMGALWDMMLVAFPNISTGDWYVADGENRRDGIVLMDVDGKEVRYG